MAGCCDSRGCDAVFGDRFARRTAARYRRRGLSATEQRMVDIITSRGVEGATVLEIGGGVGALQIELLRAGAAHATNLELVDSYDTHARRLAVDAGVAERMERRVLDIAVDARSVAAADVVVLHRVVCCYPDVDRLLGAAAGRAQRLLVFSHPPRNPASRAWVATQNTVLGLTGKTYRTFLHRPSAMVAAVESHGLSRVAEHRGFAWHVLGFERQAA